MKKQHDPREKREQYGPKVMVQPRPISVSASPSSSSNEDDEDVTGKLRQLKLSKHRSADPPMKTWKALNTGERSRKRAQKKNLKVVDIECIDDDDSDSHSAYESHLVQQAPATSTTELQSIGIVNPTFNLYETCETDSSAETEIEFISFDQSSNHSLGNRHSRQITNIPDLDDSSPNVGKSPSGIFRHVKNKLRKQISKHSNLGRTVEEDEEEDSNGEICDLDRKPHHHHHPKKVEPWKVTATLVEPFQWDPLVHTDPVFTGNVHVEKGGQPSGSALSPMILPNWSGEAPTASSLLEGSTLAKKRSSLKTMIEEECSGAQARRNNLTLYEDSFPTKETERSTQHLRLKTKIQLDEDITKLKCSQDGTIAIACKDGKLRIVKLDDNADAVVQDFGLCGHSYTVRKMSWISSTADNGNITNLMTADEIGVVIGWNVKDSVTGKYDVSFGQFDTSSEILGFDWSPDFNNVSFIYKDDKGINEDALYGLLMSSCSGDKKWCRPLQTEPWAVGWLDDTRLIVVLEKTIMVNTCLGQQLQNIYVDDEIEATSEVQLRNFVALLLNRHANIEGQGANVILVWSHKIIRMEIVEGPSKPTVINPKIEITCGDWSSDTGLIAVGGKRIKKSEEDWGEEIQIAVFDIALQLISCISMGQTPLASLSWGYKGQKLVIGCGSTLLVAAFERAIISTTNGTIVAYAVPQSSENDRIALWDTNSRNMVSEELSGKIVDIANCGGRFAVLTRVENDPGGGHYCAINLRKDGSCIDVFPIWTTSIFAVTLTDSCLVCLHPHFFLLWPTTGYSGRPKTVSKRCRKIMFEDRSVQCRTNVDGTTMSLDPAQCMASKSCVLCIARCSGRIQVHCLPEGSLMHTVEPEVNFFPQKMRFNENGRQVALIDKEGRMKCGWFNRDYSMVLKAPVTDCGALDVLWSKDMPHYFCASTSSSTHIMHSNGDSLHRVETHERRGSVVRFESMKIGFINFEEMLKKRLVSFTSSHLTLVDMRILDAIRGEKDLASEKTMEMWKDRVTRIGHPRLWNVWGEVLLQQMNFDEAEIAFVKSKNYPALQCLKRVRLVNPQLQHAEVMVFLEDFNAASESYMAHGRRDLAINLWKELNDYGKVTELTTQQSARVKLYEVLQKSSPRTGDKCFSAGDMTSALKIYKENNEYDRALQCLLLNEDFEGMKELLSEVPVGTPVAQKIAEIFTFYGLTTEAIEIYEKRKEYKKAVEVSASNLPLPEAVLPDKQESIKA